MTIVCGQVDDLWVGDPHAFNHHGLVNYPRTLNCHGLVGDPRSLNCRGLVFYPRAINYYGLVGDPHGHESFKTFKNPQELHSSFD
jgi:hypothetical protein